MNVTKVHLQSRDSHRPRLRWALALSTSLLVSAAAASDAKELDNKGVEFFEKRVRPLLAERCLECHGAEKQKGALRLDTKQQTLKGGASGPVLVPGKPEESLLIKAVSYTDPDLEMPPKNRLPKAEVETLTEWIRMGAPDPRVEKSRATPAKVDSAQGKTFWAYQPPKTGAPPAVKNEDWVHTDIDRFILSKLESKGLSPANGADKATLLRRAYYDLIGLPPKPEQIDRFLNDERPDAWARQIDDLLALPQFGERWGRHWLDIVRYGESVTLRGLIFKEAWRYRDCVVESINADKPFDQFFREQIAGDLMKGGNLEVRQNRLTATTFLTLGNTNFEEQDKEQLRMDVVDEQLDTIGKAFLAQTIGCARCHDHKFDPIPTKDYYAMAGILRSTKTMIHANVSNWIEVPMPVEPELEAVIQKHEVEVGALQDRLKELKERMASSSRGSTGPAVVAAKDLPGLVIDDARATRVGEWKLSQHTGRYIGDGYLHDLDTGKGVKTLTFPAEVPKTGKYEVRLAYTHAENRTAYAPVTILSADGETVLHVNQKQPPPIDGRFISLGQFRFEQNGAGFVLVSNQGTTGHVIADAVQFIPLEQAELAAAKSEPGGDANVKKDEVSRQLTEDVKRLETELKRLKESGPKRPMVMSVQEEDIGDTHIHIRGSVHRLGEKVPRGFLQVASYGELPPISEITSGRLELAHWLTSRQNPLTARVLVNRVWYWLTGSGIVRTLDNFGMTGEFPSHPELLDYLAVEFMENGWSLKQLIREIMLSHTYQLASSQSLSENNAASGPSPATLDPENRLFWRMNRRRMEAEAIRDTMLAISGQLKLRMGGSSIQPGTAADYGYQDRETRRSLYVPVFRNALPELFEAFDFAHPSMVTGQRNVSTVAPQALFLMNHPFVQEQAAAAAQRLIERRDLKTTEDRLAYACRATLGRMPTEGERAVAQRFLGQQNRDQELEQWTYLFHALFASLDFRYLN